MLTFFWLLFTTGLGFGIEAAINHPDPATWVGATIGFVIGLLLRMGAGESVGDAFDGFDGGFGD